MKQETPPSHDNVSAEVLRANMEYHDAIAEKYEEDISTTRIFSEKAQARIKEIVHFLARSTGGGLFLDAGCGTGNVLKFVGSAFTQAVGVDISRGMLLIAKERGMSVYLGNAETMPMESRSADVISCFSVLHHLYDTKTYFSEFHRVLKPGGFLYTDYDPNGSSVLRQPVVLNIVRWILPMLTRLIYGQRTMVQEDSKIESVQKMAEYHHHFTSGLNEKKLRSDLLEAGFQKVDIFFHYDTLSLRQSQVKRGRLVHALQKWAYPFVSIIAQK